MTKINAEKYSRATLLLGKRVVRLGRKGGLSHEKTHLEERAVER